MLGVALEKGARHHAAENEQYNQNGGVATVDADWRTLRQVISRTHPDRAAKARAA